MGPLIDVLPSVVTDHKLQKPFKLSAFWLYFCQLFYIKNVGKIRKRKNVAIIEKRIKHFFTSVVTTTHYDAIELGLLTMGAWAWMR